MPDGDQEDTLYLIPHTHWEGAVFKTRQQYLEMGLPNILAAIRLLEKYPSYRFALDQVCYVEPFLRRHPEEEPAFRRFLEEGRLEIVGGTEVMPDVNMPGGESFVRQMLYGKRFFRRGFGVEVTTGWLLDTFGHHAQMPQILRLAGYGSYWFFRGVPGWEVPSEFLWEGIDGSRIPAFWLPHGYSVGYGSPPRFAEFSSFFRKQFDALAPFARGPGRAAPAGADVSSPEEHLPAMVEEFNHQPDRAFHLQIAVPSDYEAAIEERWGELQVLAGELNPIFQGAYSSRIELKQLNREMERLLTTAEKLGVLLDCLGVPLDREALRRAWELVLFNQAHDLMSGVMTDQVYDEALRDFESARRMAEDQVRRGLEGLVTRIDTRGEGVPLLVFNALGWPRDDVVTVDVDFTEDGVLDLKLVTQDGQPVPVQIMESLSREGGGLLSAKLAFAARGVPPLGYSVYRLLPLRTRGGEACPAETQGDVLENEHYRLHVDPGSGAITHLVVKEGNWNALKEPGNLVAMEEDRGDLWELYRPLDGGSRIAMTEVHGAPAQGRASFSNEGAGTKGSLQRGPVVSEFRVTRPFGDEGRFSTRVRLYAGLSRIDFQTKVLNNLRFVRYRLLFPTSIKGGEVTHEIPFGAIARPPGIECPAQNWVDYADEYRGVALLNRGLPGNNVADGTMMLSLLRSTRIVAYGFGGGYEPGMGSDTGFELGRERIFEYALVPHEGDWRQAGIQRMGMEFNNPLLAIATTSHPGVLPGKWGFIEISHPGVIVSALKLGEDGGVILRIYESTGLPADGVELGFSVPVNRAAEVNLLEDPLCEILGLGGKIQLRLRPYEIKTIRLEIGKLGGV